MTEHDPRRFAETLDFKTSPGFLNGPGSREEAGLPVDTGPYRVITDLCVIGYDPMRRAMEVLSLHPGVTMDQVRAKTGFEIAVSGEVGETAAPTQDELQVLRDEVDKAGVVIGRG